VDGWIKPLLWHGYAAQLTLGLGLQRGFPSIGCALPALIQLKRQQRIHLLRGGEESGWSGHSCPHLASWGWRRKERQGAGCCGCTHLQALLLVFSIGLAALRGAHALLHGRERQN
jgi:hypothetical protein